VVNADASVNATLMLFDLEKQTIPVALASTPIVLLVRGDSPHKSAKDLWAWARPIRASLRCLARVAGRQIDNAQCQTASFGLV
jgi:hypothetical protein